MEEKAWGRRPLYFCHEDPIWWTSKPILRRAGASRMSRPSNWREGKIERQRKCDQGQPQSQNRCTRLRIQGQGEVRKTTYDKGRLRHLLVDGSPVHLLELVPLCSNDDGSSTLASLERTLSNGDLLLVSDGVLASLGKVHPDLVLLDLGVVDGDVGGLVEEVVDEGDGGRLSGVSGVLCRVEGEVR